MRILSEFYTAFFDSGLVGFALWILVMLGGVLAYGIYVLLRILASFFDDK
jgi:hypothetical protein